MSELIQTELVEDPKPKKARAKKVKDPNAPKPPPKHFRLAIEAAKSANGLYLPGPESAICGKCKLKSCGAKNPYMPYVGSEDPLITFVVDGVSKREDENGQLGTDGQASMVKRIAEKLADKIGFPKDRMRFVSSTRCSDKVGGNNLRTWGNWCRTFLVQDINLHPPALIVPVGTVALGLLSHKSDANAWADKLLTYRGLPDDWITQYPDGHPLFPQRGQKIPMWPIRSPRLVYMAQNPTVTKAWQRSVLHALEGAIKGLQVPSYERPYFRLATDVNEVIDVMTSLHDRDLLLTYDTETTGLLPQFGDVIVLMMFRWEDDDGPHAFGFPWDYEGSPLRPHLNALWPIVLKALYTNRIQGHNLTFDELMTYFSSQGRCDLEALTAARAADTMHLLYCLRQRRGGLGLELLAYDWCPEMAGYEEEMTMEIEADPKLQPWATPKGHYAAIAPEKWETHLKPYIMGDVEVCHTAAERIGKKLDEAPAYKIPLAHPTTRGAFRMYGAPSRRWVHDNILLPSGKTLTRMMGRGMFVDQDELTRQESDFPKILREKISAFRGVDERVLAWCEQQEATVEGWKLDLDKKSILGELLFNVMQLPVNRLTDAGVKKYGEGEDGLNKCPQDELIKFAAMDKFTLNSLAVNYPQVRPLIDYRKLFKAYGSYVRPMRNYFDRDFDKKVRTGHPHLAPTGCVHPRFNLTGTGSGRLSANEPNLQQLPRDGIIKRLYASRFGERGCIYQADKSQIELRLTACACGDPTMVQAYFDKTDLHSLTASKVFKIPYEHFTKEYMEWLQGKGREKEAKMLNQKRSTGKTTNFLTAYGGGAFGLMTSLASSGIYLTITECEDIIESFFDAYPALRRHIGLIKGFILENGVSVSMTGRVRIFEEVFGENEQEKAKALRSGYNHVIQSTASDMMLICLNCIEFLMRQANLQSILVCTVHDSLYIDALRSELPQVHEIVMQVMNHLPEVFKIMFGDSFDTSWMIVPFEADAELGTNVLDSRKIVGDSPDWDALLAVRA